MPWTYPFWFLSSFISFLSLVRCAQKIKTVAENRQDERWLITQDIKPCSHLPCSHVITMFPLWTPFKSHVFLLEALNSHMGGYPIPLNCSSTAEKQVAHWGRLSSGCINILTLIYFIQYLEKFNHGQWLGSDHCIIVSDELASSIMCCHTQTAQYFQQLCRGKVWF